MRNIYTHIEWENASVGPSVFQFCSFELRYAKRSFYLVDVSSFHILFESISDRCRASPHDSGSSTHFVPESAMSVNNLGTSVEMKNHSSDPPIFVYRKFLPVRIGIFSWVTETKKKIDLQ